MNEVLQTLFYKLIYYFAVYLCITLHCIILIVHLRIYDVPKSLRKFLFKSFKTIWNILRWKFYYENVEIIIIFKLITIKILQN